MRSARGRERIAVGTYALLILSSGCSHPPEPARETPPSDGSISPFIDQQRRAMRAKDLKAAREKGEPPPPESAAEALAVEPFIDAQRKKIAERDAKKPSDPAEGYTARLKRTDPKLQKPDDDSLNYSGRQKELLPAKETGGAIAALKEGRSELHQKIEGEIHQAAGVRIGFGLNRQVSAVDELAAYNTVFSGSFSPEVRFFYEYQFFHSENYGSLGLYGSLGIGYGHGYGQFAVQLQQPWAGGGKFPTESQTKFAFYRVPLTLGATYRFNLFRYVRPYVLAGPSIIPYFQSRDDGGQGYHGLSRGLEMAVGAAVPLDWISKDATWALYSAFGIKKYYLTAEYNRASTFGGDVDFTIDGLYLGFTFEF